jgi:glycosyltransferase involved in cell wall biosynthesis
MKIIYIHQHFTTSRGKGGTRSYDVAKHMVNSGHKIYMVTGNCETSGMSKVPFYKLFEKRNYDGIETYVCNCGYSNDMGKLRRMFSFMWFAFAALLAGICIKKPDLVFATSTPIFVGIPGYILSRLKRVKFVFEVRDIWPEILVKGGWADEKSLYIRFMAWLEDFLYRHADKVLLVSEAFKESITARGYPEEKFEVILLGGDGQGFVGVEENTEFRKKYGLEDKFVGIFTGSHGAANGLDYILDAAKAICHRDDIAFVMMGKGGQRQALMDRAKDENINNVIFAKAVTKSEVPGILMTCDAGLMILKNIGGYWDVTPNKLFDYMFASLPILINFTGPSLDILESDNSGLHVNPDDSQSLADAMVKLEIDRERTRQMGENARKAAWEKYDRSNIATQMIKLFQRVVEMPH